MCTRRGGAWIGIIERGEGLSRAMRDSPEGAHTGEWKHKDHVARLGVSMGVDWWNPHVQRGRCLAQMSVKSGQLCLHKLMI